MQYQSNKLRKLIDALVDIKTSFITWSMFEIEMLLFLECEARREWSKQRSRQQNVAYIKHAKKYHR